MHNKAELKRLAEFALKAAKRAGANSCSAHASTSRQYEVSTKDREIEMLKESQSLGLSIDIYAKGRYGSFSTSDIKESAVESFVKKAVEMVKLTDIDEARGLPDREYIAPMPSENLEVFDEKIAASLKAKGLDTCLQMTDAAKKELPKGINIQASFSETHHRSALLTSDGFEGNRESTMLNLVCGLHVEDRENRKQSGYDARSARIASDAGDPADIGRVGAERAKQMLGAAPLKTGEYPVVIANYWGDYFVSLILQAANGQNIYRKMSCLADKKEKKIASDVLTLIDNPFVPRGLGSRHYDGEGMVAKKLPLLEAGVLKNFYYNCYWARKQGVKPTTGSSSNIEFKLGSRSGEEMAASMDRCILITSFIGGNFNAVSGDFSAGIRGLLYENGKVAKPVSEMNIAGNLLEVLPMLEEVGNDPYPYMSIRSPAMRFKPLMFSGV